MDNQKHYCIAKLSESAHLFSQIRIQLPKLKEKYDKCKDTSNSKEVEALSDLQKLVKMMWQEFTTVIQLLSEFGDDSLLTMTISLFSAIKRFDYLKADYSKLCDALATFESKIPTEESNINTAALGRLMNRVKMGYFPTELTHVNLIQNAITFPDERQVNILDPCCGCGLALNQLAHEKNVMTYGVELDEYRAEQAQERLDRVGFGSFFHSRVSHEAFHCIFLNPPYLSVMTEGGGSARLEKTFLAESIPHLMTGGLLIYIIPYYRITADICRMLADNFEDITFWKFSDSEFKKFSQVAIFAIKKKRSDGIHLVDALLASVISPELIPYLKGIPAERYALPDIVKTVELFKGASFNVNELSNQLKQSKSIKLLFEKSALDSMERHPLLPLNVSQIGLIGGSGMMNGLVECETPHIVKGRIVKKCNSEVDEQLNAKGQVISAEVREVTSNKMIFNVLTPSGFRSLT